MTTSDLWDAETAARYDETSAFMFTPEVLEPGVAFLADLAGGGPRSSWRSARAAWPSRWSSAGYR